MKIFKLKVRDRHFIVKAVSERAAINKLKDSGKLVEDSNKYVFNFQNKATKEQAKISITAEDIKEALKIFSNSVALKGYGIDNIYIISISPNEGTNAYGNLKDLLHKYMDSKITDSAKLYQMVYKLYNQLINYVDDPYKYDIGTNASRDRKLEELYKLSMSVYSQMKTEVENMQKYGREVDIRTGKGNPDVWLDSKNRELLKVIVGKLEKLSYQEKRNQKFKQIADMISDLIKRYGHYAYKDSSIKDKELTGSVPVIANKVVRKTDNYVLVDGMLADKHVWIIVPTKDYKNQKEIYSGTVAFSIREAVTTMDDFEIIAELEKKYGRSEARRRWLARELY